MPRNKYPEQTVEKILSAAERLFAQKGYAKTTLQDIIDTTGLSKGAVYHHFKSKEGAVQPDSAWPEKQSAPATTPQQAREV